MRQGPPQGGRRPNNGGGRGRFSGGGHQQGGGHRGFSRPNNNPDQVRSAAALRHQTFDSNGPDVRVRGNAWQVCEKYQALARDATSAGDKVAAENYLQHAEHYMRIVKAIEEATLAEQRARGINTPQPEAYAPPQNAGEGQVEVRGPMGSFVPQGSQAQPAMGQQPAMQGQQPAMSQGAEVQMKQQPSPFFTPEEREDDGSGPTQLVANR